MTLSRLHGARESADPEAAWADFIKEYSDVLLHVCRSLSRDRDSAMDSYAFALQALRDDGFRRLRAYIPDGKTSFVAWLTVVTRRLVVDYNRRRYGRSRSHEAQRRDETRMRRKLEDLVADVVDPDQLEAVSTRWPDADIRHKELSLAIQEALGTLEADDQLLIALRFRDGRSARDIAKALGYRSVFHVYRKLNAALATLRQALRVRGVEENEP